MHGDGSLEQESKGPGVTFSARYRVSCQEENEKEHAFYLCVPDYAEKPAKQQQSSRRE